MHRSRYYNPDEEHEYNRLAACRDSRSPTSKLSVRSRNCLKKMNIRTLGDLTRERATAAGEQEPGETSLQEIKIMMTSKGLR